MALSAPPSPPAPRVSADEAIAAAAPWSAPLLRDVLTVELPDEDLDAAALGVTLTFSDLLEHHTSHHTLPGWLPGLLDEQRCPLFGPTPSFCFTEDHGAVPIGVVRPQRPMPLLASSSPAHIDLRTCTLVLHPIRREPATRRCTNTSCSSSSVCA